MDWDVIRRFFRESPQAWIVGVAAVLAMVLVVWGVYGSFQLEIGRFFAAEERCPGRASQPPDWAPDFVCNREPQYDYALDEGCLPTYTGASGTGEFLYITDRRPEPDSGVVWERYPKMCVEKPQDCPKNWTAFGNDFCIRECDPRAGGSGCDGSGTGGTGGTCPTYSGTPTAPVLSVQCGSPNVLTWTNPLSGHAMQNVVQRMAVNGGSWTDVFSEGGCWNTFGIGTYTDNSAASGQTYQYRVKFTPSIVSNVVLCGGGATTSIAPTSIVPTPPPPPLVCSPTTQTVALSGKALLQASGGTGVYQWDITGGGLLEEGGNEFVSITYATAGIKNVRVSSGAQSARCSVTVADQSSPQTGGAVLTVSKYARNTSLGDPGERTAVTVSPGQVVEFIVRVTNAGNGPTSGLLVRDEVPSGMSYQAGSTTVEGQAVLIETITTSGLFLGRLEAGDSVTVRWAAIADQTAILPSGPQMFRPRVVATAQQLPDIIGDTSVTVYGSNQGGTGSVGGAGGVQTGPGDAVIAALMFAATLTLLYTAYTRSPLYRRREATRVSEDQGPLDFRA